MRDSVGVVVTYNEARDILKRGGEKWDLGTGEWIKSEEEEKGRKWMIQNGNLNPKIS